MLVCNQNWVTFISDSFPFQFESNPLIQLNCDSIHVDCSSILGIQSLLLLHKVLHMFGLRFFSRRVNFCTGPFL